VCDGRLYIGTGQDPEHFDGVGHLWCIDLARAVALGRTNPGRDVSPRDTKFDPADPANKSAALAWHYGGPQPEPEKYGRDFLFGRTLSTCAVHDGLCYAVDLIGFVYCLDAKTGERYWVYDMKSETWSSPYWADHKIYLGNADGDLNVFAHGRIPTVVAKIDVGRAMKTTVIAANGVLFVPTESHLVAVAAPPR
jgi:outer membrane protein assembly factor BamB